MPKAAKRRVRPRRDWRFPTTVGDTPPEYWARFKGAPPVNPLCRAAAEHALAGVEPNSPLEHIAQNLVHVEPELDRLANLVEFTWQLAVVNARNDFVARAAKMSEPAPDFPPVIAARTDLCYSMGALIGRGVTALQRMRPTIDDMPNLQCAVRLVVDRAEVVHSYGRIRHCCDFGYMIGRRLLYITNIARLTDNPAPAWIWPFTAYLTGAQPLTTPLQAAAPMSIAAAAPPALASAAAAAAAAISAPPDAPPPAHVAAEPMEVAAPPPARPAVPPPVRPGLPSRAEHIAETQLLPVAWLHTAEAPPFGALTRSEARYVAALSPAGAPPVDPACLAAAQAALSGAMDPSPTGALARRLLADLPFCERAAHHPLVLADLVEAIQQIGAALARGAFTERAHYSLAVVAERGVSAFRRIGVDVTHSRRALRTALQLVAAELLIHRNFECVDLGRIPMTACYVIFYGAPDGPEPMEA